MSTERPDNDATDPVGGHVRGPADGAAEDAVTGPPEDTAENTVADAAESGTATAAAEDPAEDTGEAPADGTAESGAGHAEEQAEDPPRETAESSTGHAQAPAERTAEPDAGPAEGHDTDPADGAAEPEAGHPGEHDENATDGTAKSGAGHVERHDADPADGTAKSGSGDGGNPVAAPAGDAAGRPGEGVAASPEGFHDQHPDGSRDQHPDGSPAGAVADTAVVPVEGAGNGAVRRRRTPAVVASVVAAVLLVGGGGAYLSATASGGGRSGTPGTDTTPPLLALDGYTASTGATGGTAGIAPGEPDPYGTVYRASGPLPAGPGSAQVRWAEGRVTRAEVARLAKALDLTGTPRLTEDAWTVGSVKDGSEPNLRVNVDAPGTWTFSASVPGTDTCVKGKPCRSLGFSVSGGTLADPVSEAVARKAAAPVLKAVGQDDAKVDASQLMNQVRVVNADPVVDGLPTYGWTTGLRIGADGHLLGGSGQLKTPVEGDAYPVIGAKKTLDLMNGSASATGEPRMGPGGCASPVPLKDRDEMPCEHPSPAKPRSVTVEKATFGLAAQRANGRQALVPSWLFEVRSPGAQDTYTVTHPAVDPAFLASPQSPAPPSADPTVPVPSGEPSSPAATHGVAVQGYAADGRNLKVYFTGGVCADYTVSARESSGAVTVTVTERPWKNKVCIMIAKIYERTVRLDAPLGDREVMGSDGKAIHHGRFGVPETSGAASAEPR
ncbi:hypothetical protein ACH4S8_19525 [Streptomyces sp. NPDC021080]|uniref:hypothetical protein n=1 Tax=Streptomyces sp. NPDC021080 TaxID=3365110 RepID=UPI003788A38C